MMISFIPYLQCVFLHLVIIPSLLLIMCRRNPLVFVYFDSLVKFEKQVIYLKSSSALLTTEIVLFKQHAGHSS